jgi:phosphate transport system substrate-binding protein
MKFAFISICIAALSFVRSGSENPGTKSSPAPTVQTQTLKLSGSTTVAPLAQKAAESFAKTNKSLNITISEGGSGVGIANLIDGTTDIAMSSREMKESEKAKFEAKKQALTELKIADDALAVIVHPSNKVSQLNRQQLEDIFTGKVTNWNQVGGSNLKITPVSRESSSGTYEFFKEEALSKKEFTQSALFQNANGGILSEVSRTEGAIGYVGLAFATKKIKKVAVSFSGNTYVEPSVDNVKNKTYPLARPLYFYYLTTNAGKAKPFTDYMVSAKGQAEVKAIGYIPLK